MSLLWFPALFTDATGDGVADLFVFARAIVNMQLSTTVSVSQLSPPVLQSVTNGFGVTTTIAYSFMSDPSVYTPGSGSVFPVRDLGSSRSVVGFLGLWLT